MSERPPDTVAVPKSVLLLLILVLMISLMLLSFLIGRQSAPATVVVTPVTPTTKARSEDPDRLSLRVGPPPVQRAPEPPPEPVAEAPEVVAAPQAVAVTRPKPRPRPVKVEARPVIAEPVAPPRVTTPPADAAKIRQYLADVDAITAQSGELGDPTEFATGLLHQSMMGDTSGFDQLLHQVKSSQAKLAKVSVPSACQEHHRLATSQLKGSLELLQDLKQAMVTSDSMALAALSAKGQSMQSEAQKLQRITRELKEKSST